MLSRSNITRTYTQWLEQQQTHGHAYTHTLIHVFTFIEYNPISFSIASIFRAFRLSSSTKRPSISSFYLVLPPFFFSRLFLTRLNKHEGTQHDMLKRSQESNLFILAKFPVFPVYLKKRDHEKKSISEYLEMKQPPFGTNLLPIAIVSIINSFIYRY